MKNAARRNRLPPPPPLSEEDRQIQLYLWHVTRGNPEISTIRVPFDVTIGDLRSAICAQEGYSTPLTLKSDLFELSNDSLTLEHYGLSEDDIVRVIEVSAASSSAARA